MTPIEFLYRLKQLPDDTALHIAHMGAAFEMLSPVLVRKSIAEAPSTLKARLTNETMLASWLGEPNATIRSWRIEGSSGSNIRYRLGSVYDWIINHIAPLLSKPLAETGTLTKNSNDINAYWKSAIPALVIDGKLVGFFWSLESDAAPTDHAILDDPNTLALEPARMTMAELIQVEQSLRDQADFASEIHRSPNIAAKLYEKWKRTALPAVLAQFYRASLGHNAALADAIGKKMGSAMSGGELNLTAWFYTQLLVNDFCNTGTATLIDACTTAIEYGTDIHRDAHIADSLGRTVFQGNIGHLLADTKGDNFRLRPIDACFDQYDGLLLMLLNAGLNADKRNDQQRTARAIAQGVNEIHGDGQSLFKTVLDRYESHVRLEYSLPPRKVVSRKPVDF